MRTRRTNRLLAVDFAGQTYHHQQQLKLERDLMHAGYAVECRYTARAYVVRLHHDGRQWCGVSEKSRWMALAYAIEQAVAA